MSVSIPALADEMCPKCGSSNTDKKFYVWRVSDERGLHFECNVCANAWKASDLKRTGD